MAAIDLISPSTFIDAWATAGVTLSIADSNFLSFLVTAASDGIQRWLNRWMVLRDYIEIRQPLLGQWDKPEPDYISLSWFPVVSTPLNPSATVRTNRQTAITIANVGNSQNVQDAWFSLLTIGNPDFGLPVPCGVTVSSMSNGVQTDATFPFLGTPASAGFSVSAGGTGGLLTPGVYLCAYSNLSQAGESVPSATVSVTVGAGQKITATFPTLIPQATANNFYCSTLGGGAGTMTVQNAAPLAQTSYTLGTLVAGAAQQTANYATLSQLATAINNLGNGWQSQIQGPTQQFGAWPAWDVWASSGAQVGCLSTGFSQGLDVFSNRMIGVQLDQASGALYLPKGSNQYGNGPGNVWQWPGSTDMATGGGNWNGPVLLKYGAGFKVIPYAVQDACVELVKAMYERFATDTTLKREDGDKYKREAFEMVKYLPRSVKQALTMYRLYEV